MAYSGSAGAGGNNSSLAQFAAAGNAQELSNMKKTIDQQKKTIEEYRARLDQQHNTSAKQASHW